MALCKCEFCGKPFNSFGVKLCADCMQQVDSDYVIIRKYIYQNPDESDFASIAENTGVPEKSLSYLIDQGRIIIKNGAGMGARCRACGAEMATGVLCERCRNTLIAEKIKSQSVRIENPDHIGWKPKPKRNQKH